MTTAPYAKLRANIASAGNLTGVLVGAAGATCQLSQDPAGLGSTFIYEITDYPEGWTVPAGWTADAVSGVYSYAGLTPPPFTLPALPLWGKLAFRLTVNNGDPGTSGLDKTQFIDSSTVVSTPDPSGNAYEDIAYGESNQWDRKRKWLGALKRNIRRMAKQSVPDYSAVPDGYVLSVSGGALIWVASAAAFDGNFAAIFAAGSGLTVDLAYCGWSGLHKTSAIVNTWDNFAGTYGALAEGSAGVGIGTTGTIGGQTFVVSNGTTQYGAVIDTPQRPAPGTTNVNYYTIYKSLAATPGSQVHLWGSAGFQQPLFQNSSDQLSVYAGSSLITTAATANTWARYRASLTGATSGNNDEVKWGSAAAVTGFAGNGAGGAGAFHGMFAAETGTNKAAFSLALHICVRGPKASFLTQAALADAKIDAWFGAGVIQH